MGDPDPELEYLTGVREEHRELSNRLDKLSLFISDSPIYQGLSRLEQRLLSQQQQIMGEYLEILEERLRRPG